MYLLGYDLGSSSLKASLVDAGSGKCIAQAFYPKQEAPIASKERGWAEQNPFSWLSYLHLSTADVLSKAREKGCSAADVKAIGISYQMHGLVCVDKNMNPLRPSIIWCDSRAVPYGQKAFEQLGADWCLPHLLNSPGNFTAAKLAWVKDNEPDLFNRIWKIMLPGDYIAARLSGTVCTTVSGLSEGVFWDFEKDALSEKLLDYFGFAPSILPDIRPSFGEQGCLTKEAAALLGIPEGTPITYRAGDQPNNAVSLNVFNPGEIASTAGTSGVVYGIIDHVNYDPLSRVNGFAHVNHSAKDPRIGMLLCINGTGILNSWLRRNVAPDLSYSQMNEAAASVPIGSDGVSILPFGNGTERMLENRESDCSVHGLQFNRHGRQHLLRAAQEGIAFSFQYGIEIMQQMGMKVNKIHAGMANMFLSPVFRETLAAVSGASIELMDTDGATGAAKAAGIGAGIYHDSKEAFSTLECIEVVSPSNEAKTREAYERWKSQLLNN